MLFSQLLNFYQAVVEELYTSHLCKVTKANTSLSHCVIELSTYVIKKNVYTKIYKYIIILLWKQW